MAVIVDEPFVAERLGADDEAAGAIGAQPRDGADHPVGRDVDRGQAARPADPRDRRHAARKSEARCGGAEEEAAIHRAHP